MAAVEATGKEEREDDEGVAADRAIAGERDV